MEGEKKGTFIRRFKKKYFLPCPFPLKIIKKEEKNIGPHPLPLRPESAPISNLFPGQISVTAEQERESLPRASLPSMASLPTPFRGPILRRTILKCSYYC